jgi:hypothetical protein
MSPVVKSFSAKDLLPELIMKMWRGVSGCGERSGIPKAVETTRLREIKQSRSIASCSARVIPTVLL